MAALPILAFLEFLELEATAAALLETWLAEETAASVAAAATKAAAAEAGKIVDETLYENFTNMLPDSVKNAPDVFKESFWLLEDFLRTNDPRKIIEAERKRNQNNQPPDNSPAKEDERTEANNLDSSQPGQGLVNYSFREKQKQDQKIPEPANQPAELPAKYIDPMLPKVEQERLRTEETLTREAPTAEDLKNSWNEVVNPGDRFDSKQYGPRDLARLLIDCSKQLVKTLNPTKANLTVLETNPQSFGLMSKVTGYLANKSLPNTEEYRKIAAVYNGRNIDYLNFRIARNAQTGLIEVTGIDETGAALTLPQTVGTVLPAVPGTVFMGPLSANDQLPTEGRVEDYFSFFHDYSWKDGNFNRVGDLQFISRLSQNLDRVRPENRALVQSTIIYFTNISLTLGLLKNQKTQSVGDDEEVAVQSGEDIFDVLGMVDKSEVSPGTYDELKNEFYSVMQEEMTNYQKTDGFFTNLREHYVDNLVDNLEIQLN